MLHCTHSSSGTPSAELISFYFGKLQAYGLLLVVSALLYPSASDSSPSSKRNISTPRKSLLTLALVSFLFLLTSFTSSHCPTSSLRPDFYPISTPNNTRILASRRGPTGWIVVGEQVARGQWFRYMRADHSLLGGLWTGPSRDKVIEGMKQRQVSLWEKVDEEEVVRTAETIYVSSSPLPRFRLCLNYS